MELTLFGQIAFTILTALLMVGSFPLMMYVSDFVEDHVRSFFPVLMVFLVWLVVFLGLGFLVPLYWGGYS